MFANPNWFRPRKYGGWGLMPVTVAGWLYVIAFVLVVSAISASPLSYLVRQGLTALIVIVFMIDIIDIMIRGKKDERDVQHEAIAERNASWAMVTTIVVAVAYQTLKLTPLWPEIGFDAWLIIVLVIGAAVKGLTYIQLERR